MLCPTHQPLLPSPRSRTGAVRLSKLRALYLRDCPFVDDWCVDRVCGEYRHSLQHLDLSGCRRVTDRGLEGVAQLK